jgi:hypothetical protein
MVADARGPLDAADRTVDEHTPGRDGDPKGLEDAHDVPTVDELRREQRREAAHVTYAHTQGHIHGLLGGGLVFGAAGLVLGALIGFIAFDGDSPARFVVPIIVAVFSAWVGVVYWGGRTPELENETLNIYGEPEDGTTLRDPGSDDRGRQP